MIIKRSVKPPVHIVIGPGMRGEST